MTDGGAAPAPRAPDQPPLPTAVRNTMVGCLTIVVGFFGGGMMAVLVGKGVDLVTGCTPSEGLPTCITWAWYVAVGGVIGAIGLTAVVLTRLRRGDAAARNSVKEE